jgi:hypothetical protein
MRSLVFSLISLVGVGVALVSYDSGAQLVVAQAPAKPAVIKDHELPSIALPDAVSGTKGAFIKVRAETNGSEVRWVAVTPGLNVFPSELLKDSRVTVVTASENGSYVLMAYTALHDMPSDPAYTTVTIGGTIPPGPEPPPVPPGPEPPPSPIPDDEFGNVGKLAYESANKLSATARAQAPATAALYRTVVKKLEVGELINATAAAQYAQAERTKTWGASAPEWTTSFVAPIGARWNELWAVERLDKTQTIKFYAAVATGLEAVK